MNWEVLIVPLGEKHQPQKWTDGGAPQQKSQLLSSLLAVVLTHGELGPSVWTQCGSAFPEPPVYTVQWHLSCLQNRDGYKSCCKVQWVVTASQSWWCARGKGCAPPAALKDGRNIPSSSHFVSSQMPVTLQKQLQVVGRELHPDFLWVPWVVQLPLCPGLWSSWPRSRHSVQGLRHTMGKWNSVVRLTCQSSIF